MSILLHHSSEAGAPQRTQSAAQDATATPLVPAPQAFAGLQCNHMRHPDPTPGSWLDEDPIGCAADDDNLTRYVS